MNGLKTLIVCATKYGATRICAEKIARSLPQKADIVQLGKDSVPPLSEYDAVILGSSVYMGRMRKEMAVFAKKNEAALLEKKLALFLCCIQDLEEPLKAQMESGFSKKLMSHACACRGLGGTVDMARLSRLDRFIMNLILGRRRSGTGGNVDTLSEERIRDFARAVSR